MRSEQKNLGSPQPQVVKTKLLREIRPGRFLGLGFGDIAATDLQLVIVSSFLEFYFARESAVGAISQRLGEHYLRSQWPKAASPGDVVVYDHVKDRARNAGVNFDYLVVLFTGYYEPRPYNLPSDSTLWLNLGLSNVSKHLQLLQPASVDLTALGTQFARIERTKAFNIIAKWALGIFDKVSTVNLIRITSNDLDTFVDLFEALYEIPGWKASSSVGGDLQSLLSTDLGPYGRNVQTVLHNLDHNPVTAIAWCRTTLESVVRDIYKHKSRPYPASLHEAIGGLKAISALPEQLYTYLDVVRKLGNLAVHKPSALQPSEKDAEIVLSLTLRVIQYWNENKGHI